MRYQEKNPSTHTHRPDQCLVRATVVDLHVMVLCNTTWPAMASSEPCPPAASPCDVSLPGLVSSEAGVSWNLSRRIKVTVTQPAPSHLHRLYCRHESSAFLSSCSSPWCPLPELPTQGCPPNMFFNILQICVFSWIHLSAFHLQMECLFHQIQILLCTLYPNDTLLKWFCGRVWTVVAETICCSYRLSFFSACLAAFVQRTKRKTLMRKRKEKWNADKYWQWNDAMFNEANIIAELHWSDTELRAKV